MAAEAEGEVAVPPTLQALLAARLDQLESAERSVLERGAVEGEIFHRGAVQALSDNGQVTPRLASLVRKGLIRPDTGAAPRRGRLPLPPPADPRRRLRRPAQGDQSRAARALRRLARTARRRSRRAGRDPRLPPRAGSPLQGRARAARSGARRAGRRAARRRRPPRALAGRRSRGRPAARAGARADPAAAARCPPRARSRGRAAGAAPSKRRSPSRRPSGLARPATRPGRHSPSSSPPTRATAVRGRPLPSTSSSGSRGRRCRCSSRQKITPDSHGSGTRSATASRTSRGRFEEWAQAAEQALRHSRLAGQHAFGLAGLARRARPRAAAGRRGAADARRRPPGEPAALERCSAAPSCSRCSAASTRPGRSRFQPASATRELERGRRGRDMHLAEIAALAGDHATAAEPPAPILRHAREAAATEPCSRPPRRSSAARCARSAATTRRSRSRSSAASSATSKISRRRCCGGRCRRSSTPHRGEHAEAERLAREAVAIAERTDALNCQGDALCDLAEVLARRRPHRRGRRRARAGARALRAQEEPRHDRPGASAPGRGYSRTRADGPHRDDDREGGGDAEMHRHAGSGVARKAQPWIDAC